MNTNAFDHHLTTYLKRFQRSSTTWSLTIQPQTAKLNRILTK